MISDKAGLDLIWKGYTFVRIVDSRMYTQWVYSEGSKANCISSEGVIRDTRCPTGCLGHVVVEWLPLEKWRGHRRHANSRPGLDVGMTDVMISISADDRRENRIRTSTLRFCQNSNDLLLCSQNF